MKESNKQFDDVKASLHTEAWQLAKELDSMGSAYTECIKASAMIRRLVGELNKYKMAWNMAENELEKAEERNLKIVRKNEHLLGEFFRFKEELECALDYIKQYQIEVKD
jgi:hypothetical protein